MGKIIVRFKDGTQEVYKTTIDAPIVDTLVGKTLEVRFSDIGYKSQLVGTYKPKSTEPIETTTPPPEPPASGTLLYDSERDVDWPAIQKQLDTKNAGLPENQKLDYVRFDNIYGDQSKVDSGYIRTNASGDPRLLLFPATHEICLEHDGKYGRLYFGKRNYNSKLVCKLKVDSCDNGFSAKLRNRHQFRQYCREVLGYTQEEADAIADILVQGGQGIGLRCSSVDNDLEVWHGKEISGPSGSFSPKIEPNVYQNLEFSVFDKSGKIHIIDKLNGKIIKEGDISAPSQFFNKSNFDEWSEFWIRYNTAEKPNQRLFVKNVQLFAL